MKRHYPLCRRRSPHACLRRARHLWVFSPSSGPASPRVAASTCSVSFSGLLGTSGRNLAGSGENRRPADPGNGYAGDHPDWRARTRKGTK